MKRPRSTDEAIAIVERFDSLPIDKRLDIFSKLSPRAREELIETISQPGELMKRISEEEIFFTIKELGEENALNLIHATTGKQLEYILDIDLWWKNLFDAGAARRWIEIIAALGPEKILQFVQTVDEEIIITTLHRFIRVKTRDPDIDLTEQLDSLPPFTLDNRFFLDFRVPDVEEALKNLLLTIFQWSHEYYAGLMHQLEWGIHLETEETAFKFRQARLADHGFPDFDEAVEIYRYVGPREVAVLSAGPRPTDEETSTGPHPLLEYPLTVSDPDNLFMRCLRQIGDPLEKDRLSTELAHLANKVMIADTSDPGSVDNLRSALSKAAGYINIALEEQCGANLAEAIELLRSAHVEILFRRGFSLIMDLRKEALKLIRGYVGGVDNLGTPLAGLVSGLLQKRPFYAAQVLGEKKPREFSSLEEILFIRSLMAPAGIEERWEPL